MANLPTTMHGVQLTAHGDFDTLKYATDIAVPSLASTDVLIKVMAAGVNNTDLNTPDNTYQQSNLKIQMANALGSKRSYSDL